MVTENREHPNSSESSYLLGLKKHLQRILENQSPKGLTNDWVKFCYESPRIDATYILYHLIFIVRKQLIQQDKYSVASANLIIPLTKHLNALKQSKGFAASSDEDINRNIEKIRLKHLTNELSSSKKLIDTLDQYKDLYLEAKIELKKLKSYYDVKINSPQSDPFGLADQKQLHELTDGQLSNNSMDVYQKINSLLTHIQQNPSMSDESDFNIRKELKSLCLEVDQLEKSFRHQIPVIKKMAKQLSDHSFGDLLKLTEQLESNSKTMLSTLSTFETKGSIPESKPAPAVPQNDHPLERLVEHLYHEIDEYKNCIITMEGTHDELISENNELKKSIESKQSSKEELKGYTDEIERKDKLLIELQRKNQKLEEQMLELLK